jgi:hypothetical protein
MQFGTYRFSFVVTFPVLVFGAMASQGLASQNPRLPDEYENDINIVTIDEARKIIAGRESGEDVRAVGLKNNLFSILNFIILQGSII